MTEPQSGCDTVPTKVSNTSAHLDSTFRNYAPQQAAAYAKNRPAYSSALYEKVIQYHAANSGEDAFHTLLDVGCGPGTVARGLAPYFDHVTGVDPGVEMIAQASAIGGQTKVGEPVAFEVVAAEELDAATNVQPGEVDLIVAGTAAHWFCMDKFWSQAARMLKPGGTVALWTIASLYCHPSTHNAVEVQRILSHLEDEILGPYLAPTSSRDMYVNLPLPWSVTPSIAAFQESDYIRHEWNRNGVLEQGESEFFGGGKEMSLSELGASLGTASMVTRWREAHPELVGTAQDCVALTMKAISDALGVEEGADPEDIRLRLGSGTVLLMFSKARAKS